MAEYGKRSSWPTWGEVLLVDDDRDLCCALVAQIQSLQGVCYTTWSHLDAVALLNRHADVRVIILDHGTTQGTFQGLVDQVRRARPEAVIVGSSGRDCRDEFAAAGVSRHLPKPWRASDLLALLPDRLGRCLECGLMLPLCRAAAGQAKSSWECAGCGARYRGVLDLEFPDESRVHVRPA